MADRAYYFINKIKKQIQKEILRYISTDKELSLEEDTTKLIKRIAKKYHKDFIKEASMALKKEALEIDPNTIIAESITELEETLLGYKKDFDDYSKNNPNMILPVQKKRFSIWKAGVLAGLVTGGIYTKTAITIAKKNSITNFRWKRSTSRVKRPEHQDNDDKIFSIEKGDNGVLPAQLPNCKCGLELVE